MKISKLKYNSLRIRDQNYNFPWESFDRALFKLGGVNKFRKLQEFWDCPLFQNLMEV